jgi:hypothetical protein
MAWKIVRKRLLVAGVKALHKVRHHIIPKEILRKYLPKNVAKDPRIRGVRGKPNRWLIPEDYHKALHYGRGGGIYNARWIDEIKKLPKAKRDITVEDILRIRDKLIREFGLTRFRP